MLGRIQCQDGIYVPNTLLIVDDSEIVRLILRNIFEENYLVEEAGCGEDALAFIDSHEGDICAVLLDVVMPGINGIEVLRRLSKRGVLERIPVFLITAEANSQVMRDAYALGVMDVITKPVVSYVVERRVRLVVELYQARQRLDGMVYRQQSQLLEQAQRIANLGLGMIESLATAIEFRSGESGEHVRRIRYITQTVLRETPMGEGLSDEEIDRIALASVMHDVGKIAIPDQILNKPGKLTAEEYTVMKTHTTQGALLLDRISQFKVQDTYRYARDIALHHHERWDGNGYPEGLKGDEISRGAQVVAIADVYDALVSRRVYKNAYEADNALDMIKNGACGVFSPLLIESFLKVEPEIREHYRQNHVGDA